MSARWLGCALVLVGSLLDPGRALAASDAQRIEGYRLWIEQMLERDHLSPASIERDGLLREIGARVKAGRTDAEIGAWLPIELATRWLSFAPIAPTVPAKPKFFLPFDRRIHWIVGQGVAGRYSHTGANEFALDFVMPEGTQVLAARRGVVARVVDGFGVCCLPRERSHEANAVYLVHPNGLVSSYVHLRRGISVKEGQAVEAGDMLGFSGNTGYSKAPHLHFQVSVRSAPAELRSIPFRFHDGTAEGYLPKHWNLYDKRPPAGVELRVSVKGEPLTTRKPFPLPDRQPAPLVVEVVGEGGHRVDVTRDPGTHYVALTPWSLRVDAAGRVIFGVRARVWESLPDFVRRGVAIVSIVHRTEDGREGYFDAWFKFPDVAPPLPAPAAEGHADP
jgi:murein DD-endopeptidase MepM/ murein hydrolase activator NlpD